MFFLNILSTKIKDFMGQLFINLQDLASRERDAREWQYFQRNNWRRLAHCRLVPSSFLTSTLIYALILWHKEYSKAMNRFKIIWKTNLQTTLEKMLRNQNIKKVNTSKNVFSMNMLTSFFILNKKIFAKIRSNFMFYSKLKISLKRV